MANNRLYIVNSETKEYCCIAKCSSYQWDFGNANILNEFLESICGLDDKTNILIGTENDDDFFNKWLKDGTNINNRNEWNYFK